MTWSVLFPILVATLGPLQFGFHLSELNAIQTTVTCAATATGTVLSSDCIAFDTQSWALTQAIYTVGGSMGALLLSGRLIRHLGHQHSLVVTACVLLFGSCTEAAARHASMLALGRLTSGMGAGIATVVSPIFIAKIAPAGRRGLFGALTQVMINFGIFLGLATGYVFSRVDQWRPALLFGCGPAIVMLGSIALCPDHFRATIIQKDLSSCLETQPLLGQNTSEEIYKIGGAVQVLVDQDLSERDHEHQAGMSIFSILTDAKHRSAAIAATAAMMAQQLTGINSITMYSVSILQGAVSVDVGLISMAVAAINVLATAVFSPLPDLIGRKPCLVISTISMGISSAILALGLSEHARGQSITGMLFLVCSFSFGLGSVPFILATELPHPDGVEATSSLALAGSWLSSFLIAQTFPVFNTLLPHGQVYWLFTGIALLFGCFASWYIPETRQRP